MTLIYKDGFISDARGISYALLDLEQSDFTNDPTSTYGMKMSPTFAFRGIKGQVVITSQGDNTETPPYICEGGEVVFVNKLPPNGKLDLYVPRDKVGNSTGEQILSTSYDLIDGDLSDITGALYRPKPNPVKILFQVIKKPTVIQNAYGEGQHVFLEPKATLKIAGSSVSGINPLAFDATWAVTDEKGIISVPSQPPSPNFYDLESFHKTLGIKPYLRDRLECHSVSMEYKVVVHTLLSRPEKLWFNSDRPANELPCGKYMVEGYVSHALDRDYTPQRQILTSDQVTELVAKGATVKPTLPRRLYNFLTRPLLTDGPAQ